MGLIALQKKGTKVKEVRPISLRKNRNGQALVITGVNLETSIIGNLWVINVHNSPNQDLSFTEKFDSKPQIRFI